MSNPGYRPYEPQLTPQLVADGIWTVDGPEIDYRFAGLTLPCPTRMTIIQLSSGALWLHSPTHYTEELGAQVAAMGRVAAIVAPNSFHYAHIAAWGRAFPAAQCHASPDIIGKVTATTGRPEPLTDTAPAIWAEDFDQILVKLGKFTETVFFHRRSRSLIVTDLVQNFEAERITRRFTRLVLQLGGATGPRGTTSIDIRLAAKGHHAALRVAASRMQAWAPERIILSHGRCYDKDIAAELTKAFSWATGR